MTSETRSAGKGDRDSARARIQEGRAKKVKLDSEARAHISGNSDLNQEVRIMEDDIYEANEPPINDASRVYTSN
jgi:hypothetical protein